MSENTNNFGVSLGEDPGDNLVYDHGIPADQVEEIKRRKVLLDTRLNNNGEPVSLDEFKTIVIPWLRIHRTTVFKLNEEKVKKEKPLRVPKVPKAPKVPKVKKLTLKQKQAKLAAIIKAIDAGAEVPQEDKDFFSAETEDKLI